MNRQPVSCSRGSRFVARILNPNVRVSVGIMALVVLVVVLGPWVAPYDPDVFLGAPYAPPSAHAWLGLDYLGRDALSRTLNGGWSTVWMSVSASVIAIVAGVLVGVTAALRGGRIDHFIVWLTDILLAFPDILLVLMVAAILGNASWLIVLTIALALTPGAVRLARGVTLNVAAQEYVEAARMIGLPTHKVVVQEILPNILPPLLVHFGVTLMASVTVLSTLSFLGYGVAAPASDWGLMIHENRAGLFLQPWAVVAPIILIALFSLSANLAAEGLGRRSARTEDGAGA